MVGPYRGEVVSPDRACLSHSRSVTLTSRSPRLTRVSFEAVGEVLYDRVGEVPLETTGPAESTK